jgi:hypothetical protein
MVPSFFDAVVTSAMVVKLQEQLLARERELDRWELTLTAPEDDLVAFECALGRVHMECDPKCDRVEAVRQDY